MTHRHAALGELHRPRLSAVRRAMVLFALLLPTRVGAAALPGSIVGRVTQYESGAPLANQGVIVRQGGQQVAATTTDLTGQYGVAPLAAGTYSVEVTPQPAGSFDPPPAQTVALRPAETGHADFVLRPASDGVYLLNWWHRDFTVSPPSIYVNPCHGADAAGDCTTYLVSTSGAVMQPISFVATAACGHTVAQSLVPWGSVPQPDGYGVLPSGAAGWATTWLSVALHNGPATIRVEYLDCNYQLQVATLDINVRNLALTPVIDDQHPAQLRWDPSDPDGQAGRSKTKVRFMLRSVQRAAWPFTRRIFPLHHQADDPGLRVDQASLTSGTDWDTPRTVDWDWDGRDSQGHYVPAGIYPTEIHCWDQKCRNTGGGDAWHSYFLAQHPAQIPPPAEQRLANFIKFLGLDATAGTYRFELDYAVGLNHPVAPQCLAGAVLVYDPDLELVSTLDIPSLQCLEHGSADGLDATLPARRHRLTVPLSESAGAKLGQYSFVVQLLDNNAVWDHAHALKFGVETGQVWRRIDLDVDSDNTSAWAPPDRGMGEEQCEDEPGSCGKFVEPNLPDTDADGVPGYADGYNAFGDDPRDDASPDDIFVPLVLQLPARLDPQAAVVRISYPASDPALVVRQGTAPDYTYQPAPGTLRLWRKDGSQQRSPAPASAGGDWVAPGDQPAGALGINAAGGPVTLYVEAVDWSPSLGSARIQVELDPDGPGPDGMAGYLDAVRLTASPTIRFELTPDEPYLVGAEDTEYTATASIDVIYHDGSWEPVDHAVVGWELVGDGVLEETATETVGSTGLAVALASHNGVIGSLRAFRATLRSYRIGTHQVVAAPAEPGLSLLSDTLEVIPDDPATVELAESAPTLVGDGQGYVDVTATVRDAAGNVVADGTPVDWQVWGSPTDFADLQLTTSNGQATARIRAPEGAGPVYYSASCGAAGLAEAVDSLAVTGEISETQTVLDASVPESTTLTLTTNAADGTPVEWLASRGTLSAETTFVAGGTATVTLNSASAAPGLVLVNVRCGDRQMLWRGRIVRPDGIDVVAGAAFAAGAGEDGQAAAEWLGQVESYSYSGTVQFQIDCAELPNRQVAIDLVQRLGAPGLTLLTPTVQTDATGRGTGSFRIDSAGTADFSSIRVTASCDGRSGSAEIPYTRTPAHGAAIQQSATKRTSAMRAVGAFFGLADPETPFETTVGLVGAFVPYVGAGQDVVGVCRNLYRLAAAPDEFNAPELALSGLGLLAEGVPPLNQALAAMRKLAANGGGAALRALAGRFRRAMVAGGDLDEIADLVRKLSDDEAIAVLKEASTSTRHADRLNRLLRWLGDRSDEFCDALAGASPATIRKVTGVLHDCGESLAKQITDADLLAALRKVAEAEDVTEEILTRALTNPHQANHVLQILRDAAKTCHAERFHKLFMRIGIRNANAAKGFRYELRVAAWLTDQGEEVIMFSKDLPTGNGLRCSDYDIVLESGATWQCKCVTWPVNRTHLTKYAGWVLGDAEVDLQLFFIAVPDRSLVPLEPLLDLSSRAVRDVNDIVVVIPEAVP